MVLLAGNNHVDMYYICVNSHITRKLFFYGEKTTHDVWHVGLDTLLRIFFMCWSTSTIYQSVLQLLQIQFVTFAHQAKHVDYLSLIIVLMHNIPLNFNTLMYGDQQRFYQIMATNFICQFDYSRFVWLLPLVRKSNVLSTIFIFRRMVGNRFDGTIKMIRTSCGGEFTSRAFLNFLRDHRISFTRHNKMAS